MILVILKVAYNKIIKVMMGCFFIRIKATKYKYKHLEIHVATVI